ncbi:cobyrinic acid a,c-diamide synthase [Salimicrobium jeotgali]|uniref:Cobyrinate a,c-diamide synthase n=1 Tax=Salimicrobium jeotgali TaxID=1230341 RepID=K2FI29_9BACI|nr:cobyrinate a,c-diamide synthase [Salimicrobium jeotgali]AKG03456.1 cobyrinic acid a,c-diamide synthase [Salimicrobium jeotgali]EKE30706.1 cobyrinic acid a,c-diamide synthase [Salimicrobium jeotgali]MBM7697165.1 cobyrinic acid a,c-diamide synthase [Salimicrobium jeotgali]
MKEKKIVIAGTGSGTGKTTITLGLMEALKKRGQKVQGFKCGPDYIDPTFHTAVTGRPSRNLDSWMLTPSQMTDVFINGKRGADISVIEGMMGLFDGKSPDSSRGSAAEISAMTKSPVILVVNCVNMARSAAAVVKGFQLFDEQTAIAGVIVNEVGSDGHYRLVKTAIEQECGIPVIGYLKQEPGIQMPERHLGLIPAIERGDLDAFFDRLGDLVLETVDVDRLLEIAGTEPVETGEGSSMFEEKREKKVRIAVAKDAAFNFYYPENLEILEAYGAELIEFSPLRGERVPHEADGLYLGGGFPEEFASRLAEEKEAAASVREAVQGGLPTLAECGGFMYLTDLIETTEGKTHPMTGVIPGRIRMQENLAAIGYREVRGRSGNFLLEDLVVKGHEFHYAVFHPGEEQVPAAYHTEDTGGAGDAGYLMHNAVAGFPHFHFGSRPEVAEKWVEKCTAYRKGKVEGYETDINLSE